MSSLQGGVWDDAVWDTNVWDTDVWDFGELVVGSPSVAAQNSFGAEAARQRSAKLRTDAILNQRSRSNQWRGSSTWGATPPTIPQQAVPSSPYQPPPGPPPAPPPQAVPAPPPPPTEAEMLLMEAQQLNQEPKIWNQQNYSDWASTWVAETLAKIKQVL